MFLQAKQFGVTITTSLDLYECYNQGLGSQLSCSESHTNIYTYIDKQKMTHAVYNVLSYAIRSSAAGSQGNGNISINMSLRMETIYTGTSNNINTNNDIYVSFKVTYAKYDLDPVCI